MRTALTLTLTLLLSAVTLNASAAQDAPAKVISHGQAVDLKSVLAADKNTVFEFYADW